MIEKRKRGRPATGRDRAYSVRLPEKTVATLKKAAKFMPQWQQNGRPLSATFSDAPRFAVDLGVEQLNNRHNLPLHGYNVRIHEAGHAVALFLAAKDLRLNPSKIVRRISIGGYNRGGGVSPELHKLTPQWELRVDIAGVVAEAKYLEKSFDEVWEDESSGGDRKQARRHGGKDAAGLKAAVDYMTKQFTNPAVWNGLRKLADYLPNKGRCDGNTAWAVYVTKAKAKN